MTGLKNPRPAVPNEAARPTRRKELSRPDKLDLPHERDQQDGEVNPLPDPLIEQAKEDLDAGLVDTDMRVTPGLDNRRRKALLGKTPGNKTS